MCDKEQQIGPPVESSSPPLARSQTARGLQQQTAPVAVAEYVASLPERLVRSAAAAGGGLLFETSNLVLPTTMRQRSKLYQATVARVMRITVEFVGGVTGRFPKESMVARELAVRKLGGNAVELASVVAVGFSPLWLLAAASDVTGGVRTYLDALAGELKRNGALSESVDVSSVDDLLVALENTSGQVADTIDIPPIAVEHMRTSLGLFRENIEMLPSPRHLAGLFADMNEASREQSRSLLVISSMVAAGAIQAGMQLGNAHIFSFYSDSLSAIRREGVSSYLGRISQPYLDAAAGHLLPDNEAHTTRLLRRFTNIFLYRMKRIPYVLAQVRRSPRDRQRSSREAK